MRCFKLAVQNKHSISTLAASCPSTHYPSPLFRTPRFERHRASCSRRPTEKTPRTLSRFRPAPDQQQGAIAAVDPDGDLRGKMCFCRLRSSVCLLQLIVVISWLIRPQGQEIARRKSTPQKSCWTFGGMFRIDVQRRLPRDVYFLGGAVRRAVALPADSRQKTQRSAPADRPLCEPPARSWLRTNGVNTNGAAAKVMNFDRLRKKVRPGTLGGDKSGLTGVPKSPCQKTLNSH